MSDKAIEKIIFQNVSFGYDEEKVIDDFSFKFERGKLYALVGNSGCGKTTLIYLMLKMFLPDEGNIYIDDISITDVNNKEIRNRISVAFQDALLNECTIKENIRFGNEELTHAEMQQIAELCEIYDFIMGLPNKFDTEVGELGDKFSGGQKQRISLAKTLAKKADIYILDEVFANMDKILEHRILENIQKLYSDKIIILISHDIDLVSELENIVVINNGHVEKYGEHEVLLEESEIYRELFIKGVK